ncbi:hypothetical protein CKO44_19305 [Rubrivivax gelatinosus]|uniref:YDG domain-containing protein n=1 Tax=Rubrivivax gelatinosus TaxID=28068 RepID=UPI001907AC91|nr:YDG domain-containing protein [Rubrivivax gelatinosus]MBK1615613.1 hypothetical protein [Rubrivivax gelatinosus]
MNRIHRTVWNSCRGAYMAVAETAPSRGKASGTTGALLAGVLLTAGGPALAGGPAAAVLPTGGQVAAGAAQIGRSGSTLTVTQTSARTAINWNSFSIGKSGTVNFVQPDAGSVALNRVTGTERSAIDGALKANGQVFILNPNGVLFGKGARVDTAGLVATTLGLNDADFMAGKTRFSGQGGAVSNLGTLSAADGGYVALMGTQVRNDGVITARLGTVALAAGSKVSLNFNGNSLAGVVIDAAALDTLVSNGGAIHADGGTVMLTAKAAAGLLDAMVNNTGEIRAQTIAERGGRILLLAEDGALTVGGTLDASAPSQGNGGSIETSGARVKIADGVRITTAAAHGLTGTWLVDPIDFTIAASGGDTTGATLSSQLASNNVTIQSSTGSVSGSGDINVNDAVSWSANHTLTLDAERNINVNAPITATGSSGALALIYGQGAVDAGNPADYFVNAPVNLKAGSNFSTQLGWNGVVTTYTVITGLGTAADATSAPVTMTLQGMAATGSLSGNYVLGADIDAAATAGWNSGAGFQPIGNSATSFFGRFGGLGHTVGNLIINRPTSSEIGLFGNASGAVLRDANLTAASITGDIRVGGLLGSGYNTTVSHSSVAGSVAGSNKVGGLVGANYGVVTASTASASVTATGGKAGGLVGANYGVVTASAASGSVTATGGDVGGLVGYSYGDIAGSAATGPVSGEISVGGLVGGTSYGTITGSYATGNVIGTGDYLGGLVGFNGSDINDSYARGSVSGAAGSHVVGGLAGYNYGSIRDAYASGWVSGTPGQQIGGLVGNGSGTATHSFWDTQATGQASSTGGTGKTTAQLNDTATFTDAGWNFTTGTGTWGRKDTLNDKYPVLRSFGYSDTLTLSLALGASTKVYGNANPALTGLVLTGCSACLTVDWGSTIGPFSNVGSYAYSSANVLGLSFADGYNASMFDITLPTGGLTITPRPVSVTSVVNATRAYNAATGVAASLLGLGNVVNSDSVSLSGSAVLASKDAGTRAVSGLGTLALDNSNYTLSSVTPSGTVQITPYAVSVAAWGSAGKVYDGNTALDSEMLHVTNALGDDTVNLASGAAVLANQNAGTRAVTGLGTLTLDNANYTVSGGSVVGNALVYQRLVDLSTVNGATRSYDASNLAAASLLVIGNVVVGDAVHLGGTATLASKDVGSRAVIGLSGLTLDNPNYTLVEASAGGTVQITPLAVNVAAWGSAGKVYDGNTALDATMLHVTNVLDGDAVNLAGGAAVLASQDAGIRAVSGFGTLALDNANYTVVGGSVGGNALVYQRLLEVSTVNGATRIYDATNQAAASLLAIGNVLDGDTVHLGGTATLASRNVGGRALTSLAGLTLDNANYTLQEAAFTGSVQLTPLAARIATLSNAGKVYDGNSALASTQLHLINAVAGDSVNLSGVAELSGKDAGTRAIAGAGTLALDNANYTLAGAAYSGTAAISPRTLNLVFSVADKVFDGSAGVNATARDDRIAGDSLALSFGAALADQNVGEHKPVGISGLALGGADAGNYVFATDAGAGTTGNLNARSVTYSLAAQDPSKTYTVSGQTLIAAADLDRLVVANIANTVPGTTPGALSYTIWKDGQQVSAVKDAGRYEIRATFATADAHYAIADTGNTVLKLDVGMPTAALQQAAAQAARTDVPARNDAFNSPVFGINAPVSLAQSNPVPPNVVTTFPALDATFGQGAALSLISSPSAGETSQSVTLVQARQMLQAAGGPADGGEKDLRVPVSRNSLATIVNGGVRLPGGVDQLLFVVEAGQ